MDAPLARGLATMMAVGVAVRAAGGQVQSYAPGGRGSRALTILKRQLEDKTHEIKPKPRRKNRE